MLRIAVFATILATPDPWSAPSFAALPIALRAPPPALAWFAAHVPIDQTLARAALVVVVVAAGAALVGLATRVAALTTTLALLYLLAIPQLYGAVRHYHHLVWLAALLAASPSGDALSIDAWRRRRRGEPVVQSGVSYGLALRCAWLIAACIFFFPGVWKLRGAGLAWATGDNLVNQMRWKWLQHGRVSSLRLDLHPAICHVAALATIAFELSFPFLLWTRATRTLALIGALVFHAMTALVMFIGFGSLLCVYAALVPWHRLWSATVAARDARPRSAWPACLIGVMLLLGIGVQGARGEMRGWPFACYPTFQYLAPDTMPALEVELTEPDGTRRRLGPPRLAGVDGQRAWALAWSIAAEPRRDAIVAWLRAWSIAEPRLTDAVEVGVDRVERFVDPAAWDGPPKSRARLLTLPGGALR